MKNIYTFLIALFFVGGAMGQGCLPDGITFETQAQIDNFQTNYPNCTEIEGDVEIHGDDITNLNGLSVLTSIHSSLNINNNHGLISLEGLNNITYVAGDILIYSTALQSLDGLDNLDSIGQSLAIGIETMTWDVGNPNLNNISGLSMLRSIGEALEIRQNDSLTSLAGLDNITSIGGELRISGNSMLTSLSGLDNIEANTISILIIGGNQLLSICEVQSICDYLSSPNGSIYIHDNATGCTNQQEVEEACESVSIDEIINLQGLNIYPNPTHSSITIELPIQPSKSTILTISNTNGQQLITQPITKPQTEIDISHLPVGIYIVKVWNEKDVMVQKIIKQ